MEKAFVFLILFGLTAQTTWARSSCDLYFETSKFQRSHEAFNKISDFFGFKNDKRVFDLTFKSGQETQYWTTENGKILEQPTFIASYRGKIAIIDLNQSNRGDWSFKWTVMDGSNSKVNEVIFESNFSGKNRIPDFVTVEDSKLVITKSTTRKNQNSKVTIVMNQTMTFSKKPDGSIELTSVYTSDSISGNRILIGDETESKIILKTH